MRIQQSKKKNSHAQNTYRGKKGLPHARRTSRQCIIQRIWIPLRKILATWRYDIGVTSRRRSTTPSACIQQMYQERKYEQRHQESEHGMNRWLLSIITASIFLVRDDDDDSFDPRTVLVWQHQARTDRPSPRTNVQETHVVTHPLRQSRYGSQLVDGTHCCCCCCYSRMHHPPIGESNGQDCMTSSTRFIRRPRRIRPGRCGHHRRRRRRRRLGKWP